MLCKYIPKVVTKVTAITKINHIILAKPPSSLKFALFSFTFISMTSLLFVCLGNICRSPMAEGAYLHLIKQKKCEHLFHIDSAGTSAYHIGKRADQRMAETAAQYGIELPSRGRQVTSEDFEKFDYIIAMDRANFNDLLQRAPKSGKAKVVLMRDYDSNPTSPDVPDPYYGGQEGFEDVFQIVTRSCETLYNEIHAS